MGIEQLINVALVISGALYSASKDKVSIGGGLGLIGAGALSILFQLILNKISITKTML